MPYTLTLQDAYKTNTADQDKVIPPQETLDKIKEKLKTINLDLLESADRIDNGRLDIPVFFSICGKDAFNLTHTKKQMGKGATPIQAEASAVMELVERFSLYALKNDDSIFFTDCWKNISDPKISYDLIRQSVHDTKDNAEKARPFFEDLSLEWTWAYNLTTKQEVLIPFDWFFTINQFNGSSAGNCNEEALCQGISEVIERHVSALVCKDNLTLPKIDPDTFEDQHVKEMLEKYRKNNINLHISDMSLDTGITTISALAWDPSTFPESSEIVWTAGTAPDPEKAMSRALTEVAQLAGDFNSGSNYVASGLPKYTDLKEIEYITAEPPTVTAKDLHDHSDPNIKTELERYIKTLADRGMEIIVVKATRDILDVPAFYTIIPGTYFRERSAGSSVAMFTAKIITEKEHPAEAFSALEKMRQHLPDQYYIYFYLGTCCLDLGQYDKALDYLNRSLDLDPEPQDIPSIYSYTGVCLKDLEKYDEAIDVLKKGIKLDNEREDILNLLGFCHFKLGRYEQAIDYFKQILHLNPASAINYANIASNYRDMGDTDKAITYYKMAVNMDKNLTFAKESLDALTTGR